VSEPPEINSLPAAIALVTAALAGDPSPMSTISAAGLVPEILFEYESASLIAALTLLTQAVATEAVKGTERSPADVLQVVAATLKRNGLLD
jgi:hypothetical protein